MKNVFPNIPNNIEFIGVTIFLKTKHCSISCFEENVNSLVRETRIVHGNSAIMKSNDSTVPAE